MSVTRLCSPLGLELIVKLSTLLTVFTLILKAEAHDYDQGCYISDMPVGQSEQTVLVGRRGFVENEAFERRGA